MEKYCSVCGKLLTKFQKKFCCHSCAAKYNNNLRQKTTKGKCKIVQCKYCQNDIEVSIHTSPKFYICKNCKNKKHHRPHITSLTEASSIMDLSKRTAIHVLKRMKAKCSICGWDESTCDIHHIKYKKDGGTNEMSNLIYICPNCHRLCHTTNKFSWEFLQSKSMDKEYCNWQKFYHPSN